MLQGDTPEVIEHYLSASESVTTAPGAWIDLSSANRDGSGKIRFAAVSYTSLTESTGNHPFTNGPLEMSLKLVSEAALSVDSLAVTLYDRYGTKLVNADTLALGEPIRLCQGPNVVRLKIDKLHLNPGIYTLGLWAASPPGEIYDTIPSATKLEVVEIESERIRVRDDGLVACRFDFLGAP